MVRNYRRRIVDEYFAERMKASGALLIEGPRWCGKTSTGEHLTKSALYMQDPKNQEMNAYYSKNDPDKILAGEYPRLIDEWQVAPDIWNAVRFDIDRSGERGRFILTGSSTPSLSDEQRNRMHSGTGRIARVRMRPMSLFESGDSTGSVSLSALFEGDADVDGISDIVLDRLAYLLCRGGWPSNIGLGERTSLRTAKDYLESTVYNDISKVDGIRRNPEVAMTLMKSLARNTGTMADIQSVVRDMGGSADRKTVASYISALRNAFVVEDVPAWSPALMSKGRLRTSVKRCFADPSIAAAALGAGPGQLLNDLPSFGSLFESMCVRDLRVYAQPLEGMVYHYHDNTGLEVDCIIQLDDGRWGAVEVKLHSGEDEAAHNLIRMCRKTKLVSAVEPSFMMVLTGTGFAHVRDDGVIVVPIGCLKD